MKILIKNINIIDVKNEKNPIIYNTNILIDDKKILKINKKIDIKEKCTIIDGIDKYAIPSFINCHTHIGMSVYKNTIGNLTTREWLVHHIEKKNKLMKTGDGEFLAYYGAIEALKCGISTINHMTSYPISTLKGIKKTNLRLFTGTCLSNKNGLVNINDTDEERGQRLIDSHLELLKNKEYNFTPTLSIHGLYTCSPQYLKKITSTFPDANLLHMHFCEDELETHTIRRKYWVQQCSDVLKNELSKYQLILAHCVFVSDYDIKTISKLNASVALCPISNMKLCCGFAPFEKLIQAHINLCLGTDGVGSNDSLSFFNLMRTLVYVCNNISKNPSLLDAYKVLQMATINGAKALGIDKLTGSIEENKLADLLILDFNNIQTHPINNVVDDIVFNCSEQNIQYSLIEGKIVINNYKLLGVNEKKLMKEMEDYANHLKTALTK